MKQQCGLFLTVKQNVKGYYDEYSKIEQDDTGPNMPNDWRKKN